MANNIPGTEVLLTLQPEQLIKAKDIQTAIRYLLEIGGTGTGDVVGPGSSTDNAIARYDLATGKLIQNSPVTISDAGVINIPAGQTYNINGVPIPTGTGDFVGPGVSTDNAIVRFDGITGKLGQNSLATVSDTGSVNIPTGETYNINGVPLAFSGWGLSGNGGTTYSTDFIGTTDAVKLAIKTGGTVAMTIDTSQNVGIGVAVPNAKLQVVGLLQFNPTNFTTHCGEGAGNGNTGLYGTFVGYHAGFSSPSGERNTMVGFGAGQTISSGTYNVAMGVGALQFNATNHRNTAIGTSALQNCTSNDNSAYGNNCGLSLTTGSQNDLFGMDNSAHATTQDYTASFGGGGLYSNLTGDALTGCGVDNLRYNVSGNYSVGIGTGASPALKVPYDTLVGAFSVGEVVTNTTTPSNFGIVVADDGTNLWLATGAGVVFSMANNDALSGGTSLATALINGTVSNPNNTINIGRYSYTLLDDEINIGHVFMGRRIPADVTLNTVSLVGTVTISQGLTFALKTVNTSTGDSAIINSPNGRFRKDATGATFTLTNSFITANSIILLTQADAAFDATATSWTVSAGAGSATITFNAAPTGDINMNFLVVN